MCLGIPGRILEIYGDAGLPMGIVDFGGVRREVCLAYVADEVQAGDYAIVHVGFAISKVSEEEAQRTFQALKELSQLEELDWMDELAERSLETAAEPVSGGEKSATRRTSSEADGGADPRQRGVEGSA
jgi:hydrogenase expression/formation protein HypC